MRVWVRRLQTNELYETRQPTLTRGKKRAAVNNTKGLDQKAIAEYLRKNKHNTIVGPMEFAPDGERKETATLIAQFRGVKDKNIDQFKTSGRQVILFPERLKTGDVIVPFEKARN